MWNKYTASFWLTIIGFPYVCWLLSETVDWALIPMFFDVLYQYPLAAVFPSLFDFSKDIGLIPTHFTRLLSVSLYTVVYWVLVYLSLVIKRGCSGGTKNS